MKNNIFRLTTYEIPNSRKLFLPLSFNFENNKSNASINGSALMTKIFIKD